MMSIEIKVNGRPVAVIEAYNDGSGFDVADYPYRGVAFAQSFADAPQVFTGEVKKHHQIDGILDLSRRILECIVSGDG